MTKSIGKEPPSPKAKATGSGHFAKRNDRSSRFVTVGLATSGATSGTGFLAKTRLKKSGGSLVVTVPAPARNLLHLTDGQEMTVSVEGSKVIMEPVTVGKPVRARRPKYTLDELVAGMNPDVALTDEERAWMDEPPAGREIW